MAKRGRREKPPRPSDGLTKRTKKGRRNRNREKEEEGHPFLKLTDTMAFVPKTGGGGG